VNFPFASVIVPVVVPLIRTFAPGIAELSSEEVTVPDISLDCAHTLELSNREEKTKARSPVHPFIPHKKRRFLFIYVRVYVDKQGRSKTKKQGLVNDPNEGDKRFHNRMNWK
jgi:hypothetical protein